MNGDFKLTNDWQPDYNSERWRSHPDIPRFLIDGSTGKRYLNESRYSVRLKCFLLTIGTPFVHLPAAVCNVAYRTFKILVSRDRANLSQDLGRIAASLPAIAALQLAAIYGIVSPYDGRKLYASIERAVYGTSVLAPCFQPRPTHHAFGGDIYTRDAM